VDLVLIVVVVVGRVALRLRRASWSDFRLIETPKDEVRWVGTGDIDSTFFNSNAFNSRVDAYNMAEQPLFGTYSIGSDANTMPKLSSKEIGGEYWFSFRSVLLSDPRSRVLGEWTGERVPSPTDNTTTIAVTSILARLRSRLLTSQHHNTSKRNI